MTHIRRTMSLAAVMLLAAFSAHAQGTAKVTCKDGTASKGGQGACSGHGGIAPVSPKVAAKADAKVAKTDAKADAKVAKVEARADAKVAKTDAKANASVAKAEAKADAKVAKVEAKADAKVAKADEKAAPTATCNDGTKSYSASRAGACSGHGGVKTWMGPKK